MLIHQQIWDNIKGIGGYRAKDLEKIFVHNKLLVSCQLPANI